MSSNSRRIDKTHSYHDDAPLPGATADLALARRASWPGVPARSPPSPGPGRAQAVDDQRRHVELVPSASHGGPRSGRHGGCGCRRTRPGEERQPREVARLVIDVEALAPEEVTERVDGVRHVVQDEHAHRATPQQAGERGVDRAADQPAEPKRNARPARTPEQERPVDIGDERVLHQIRRVALAVGPLGG